LQWCAKFFLRIGSLREVIAIVIASVSSKKKRGLVARGRGTSS